MRNGELCPPLYRSVAAGRRRCRGGCTGCWGRRRDWVGEVRGRGGNSRREFGFTVDGEQVPTPFRLNKLMMSTELESVVNPDCPDKSISLKYRSG